jgi:hypothetical protein
VIKTVVSFRVAGDLVDCRELDHLTGLASSAAADEGSRHLRPVSSEAWTVEAGPLITGLGGASSSGLEGLLRQLAGILDGSADLIRAYCAAHDLAAVFEIWIQSSDGALPSLVVTPEFAQLASSVGADIDIDICPWLGDEWRPDR